MYNLPAGYIQTFTGRVVNPLALRVEDIDLRDIAHALAYQCRFVGHSWRYSSVAAHCIRVSHLVPRVDAKWGLLHDAAEAYLGEMHRHLKCHTELGRIYQQIETAAMAVIGAQFGLAPVQPASVDVADAQAADEEMAALMTWPRPRAGAVVTMEPDAAELEFLMRWEAVR